MVTESTKAKVANMANLKHKVATTLLLLRNIYKYDLRLNAWRDDFERLMLSEFEIRRLYNIFRHVDVDGSGEIDVLEMLMYMDIENTTFSRQVFSIMDVDGSGQVDFREFVISVWNYATLGDEALYLFSFDMYDHDCSNVLEISEVARMLRDLYGDNFESNKRAMQLYHKISHSESQTFGPSEFRDFSKSHPALFFPAFEMQRKLQNKVLGKRFWKNHGQKRIARSGGKEYVHIKDLIGLRTTAEEDILSHSASDMQDTNSLLVLNVAKSDEKVKELMNITDLRGQRGQKMQRKTVPRAKERRNSYDDKQLKKTGVLPVLESRKNVIDNFIQQCSQPDKYRPKSSCAQAMLELPEENSRKKTLNHISKKKAAKAVTKIISPLPIDTTAELEVDSEDSKRHKTPRSRRNSASPRTQKPTKMPSKESTHDSFTPSSTHTGGNKRRVLPVIELDKNSVHPVLGRMDGTNTPSRSQRPRRHSVS